MSFVKGATNTHAGDDVLAFERLLMRFESMIGDCNKELRNFNESSITLGKDNAGTKEKLAIYQTCQDAAQQRMDKVKASCRDLNDAYSHCLTESTSGMLPCLPKLQKFVNCAEKCLGNPAPGDLGKA